MYHVYVVAVSLRDEAELCTAGVLCAALFVEGVEADVACADRFCEHDTLRTSVALEGACVYACPFFVVVGDVDFVILDVAVGTICARGIDEAFHLLLLCCVEVNPMGILRKCHAILRVPDGARVAVRKVAAFTLAGLEAAGIDDFKRHKVDLLKSICVGKELVGQRICVFFLSYPCLQRAALTEGDGASIDLWRTTIVGIHNLSFCHRGECDVAEAVLRGKDWVCSTIVRGGEVAAGRPHSDSFDVTLSLAILYRCDDESEEVAVSLYAVVVQRSALSAAVAAEPRNLCIEMEHNALALRKLEGVCGTHEFLLRIGKCGTTHGNYSLLRVCTVRGRCEH